MKNPPIAETAWFNTQVLRSGRLVPLEEYRRRGIPKPPVAPPRSKKEARAHQKTARLAYRRAFRTGIWR